MFVRARTYSIAYLGEDRDARETVRIVEEAGRRAVAVAGDIADVQQCKHLVECAFQELRKIDILVNNGACQMTREGIEDLP